MMANYEIQINWNETTGAIADYGGTYVITITLAEVDDKLAMQSQINKLQAKINELEMKIEELLNK